MQQLPLFVREVGQQRIGDEVEHLLQLLGAGALVSDEGDERPVEMVEKFGDDLVLFLETIEDRTTPSTRRRCGKTLTSSRVWWPVTIRQYCSQ